MDENDLQSARITILFIRKAHKKIQQMGLAKCHENNFNLNMMSKDKTTNYSNPKISCQTTVNHSLCCTLLQFPRIKIL